MEINKQEVIRYLGMNKSETINSIDRLIDEITNKLLAEVSPKCAYKKYDITVLDNTVEIDGIKIESVKLSNHLKGCKSAYLFVATLGLAADNCIRLYSTTNMSRCAVAQAVCTALIENYCNEQQARIADIELKNGKFLRSRFSPGYGDFPLEHQKDILPRLEASKRVGITLTDSLLMVPTKSVSAIIGVTDSKDCNINRCKKCENLACEFREEVN